MPFIAVAGAAPGNWPAVQPGCDLRAAALSLSVHPARATINWMLAYSLSQIHIAASTRALSRARNILEAAFSPLLIMMNSLAHKDVREATTRSTGLPHWPAQYISSTMEARLTIASWHRFALQLPADTAEWAYIWAKARPGRKEYIIRTLRCRLGSTISCVLPTPRALPAHASAASPGVLNCDELFRRAATIFPADTALLLALQHMLPGSFFDQRHVFVADGPATQPCKATEYTLNAFDPMIYVAPSIVWLHQGRVLAVLSPVPLPRAPTGMVTGSRWVHPDIRWDLETRKLPAFHTTCVAQRIRVWKDIFGKFLSAEVLSVLQDGFRIPMRCHQQPCHHKNHDSVNQQPAIMDKLFAKYLITGCLRTIPPGARLPTNVYALGLVDKKSLEEPFRCIHDVRPKNFDIFAWASCNMHGLGVCGYLMGR